MVTPGWSMIQRSASWAVVDPSGVRAVTLRAARRPTSNGTPLNVSPTSNSSPDRLYVAVVVGGERGALVVLAGQQAGGQRHPGDDADSGLGSGGQHALERLAPEDVEDDLHGGQARSGDRRQGLVDCLDGHAVRRDHLLVDQRVQRVEHPVVGEDRGRRAVQLDEVDGVHAEVAPAAVEPAAERVEGERLGTSGSARWPILVATVMPWSARSRSARPTSDSLRPSPYTSAVSRKVTPTSSAVCSTASASSSPTSPQSPPSCQQPRPMTETCRPVRPSVRVSTRPTLGAGLRPPPRGTGADMLLRVAQRLRLSRSAGSWRGPGCSPAACSTCCWPTSPQRSRVAGA